VWAPTLESEQRGVDLVPLEDPAEAPAAVGVRLERKRSDRRDQAREESPQSETGFHELRNCGG
jgi:hypothetical protein